MAFWACAQLETRHERLALYTLGLAGFSVYFPQLRQRRIRQGRKVEVITPLFPGYAFVEVVLQWHAARWAPGVVRLVMDGIGPAHVPDAVIADLRQRECRGAIELPKLGPQRGDRMRITAGPFAGQLVLFDGMTAHERVAVLLALLGSTRRVELAADAVEHLRAPG